MAIDAALGVKSIHSLIAPAAKEVHYKQNEDKTTKHSRIGLAQPVHTANLSEANQCLFPGKLSAFVVSAADNRGHSNISNR